MSKLKITDGPWKVVGVNQNIIATWDDLVIARVHGAEDRNENTANAKLIAVAPAMLDALRQWQNAERTGDMAELDNATKQRDAIIAKLEEVLS